MCFLPETLPRLVIAKAAAKTHDVDVQDQAILTSKINVLKELRFVATMTFRIMFTEPSKDTRGVKVFFVGMIHE